MEYGKQNELLILEIKSYSHKLNSRQKQLANQSIQFVNSSGGIEYFEKKKILSQKQKQHDGKNDKQKENSNHVSDIDNLNNSKINLNQKKRSHKQHQDKDKL